jgi:hypothetical protein
MCSPLKLLKFFGGSSDSSRFGARFHRLPSLQKYVRRSDFLKTRKIASVASYGSARVALKDYQLTSLALAIPAIAAIFQKNFLKKGPQNFLTSERNFFKKFLVDEKLRMDFLTMRSDFSSTR